MIKIPTSICLVAFFLFSLSPLLHAVRTAPSSNENQESEDSTLNFFKRLKHQNNKNIKDQPPESRENPEESPGKAEQRNMIPSLNKAFAKKIADVFSCAQDPQYREQAIYVLKVATQSWLQNLGDWNQNPSNAKGEDIITEAKEILKSRKALDLDKNDAVSNNLDNLGNLIDTSKQKAARYSEAYNQNFYSTLTGSFPSLSKPWKTYEASLNSVLKTNTTSKNDSTSENCPEAFEVVENQKRNESLKSISFEKK